MFSQLWIDPSAKKHSKLGTRELLDQSWIDPNYLDRSDSILDRFKFSVIPLKVLGILQMTLDHPPMTREDLWTLENPIWDLDSPWLPYNTWFTLCRLGIDSESFEMTCQLPEWSLEASLTLDDDLRVTKTHGSPRLSHDSAHVLVHTKKKSILLRLMEFTTYYIYKFHIIHYLPQHLLILVFWFQKLFWTFFVYFFKWDVSLALFSPNLFLQYLQVANTPIVSNFPTKVIPQTRC